jgi:hypothetical protein
MFDPGKQTNPEFKRRVFVGIGAGAAAIGTTMAAALAQTPPRQFSTIRGRVMLRRQPPTPGRTLAFFSKYLTA